MTHALGLALAAGPERWTAMEGGVPVLVDGECIGGVGVSGGDWETDQRIAQAAVEVDRRELEVEARAGGLADMARTASRRLHWHGLVVGRARRRHQALGQDRDRRLLHALGGQAHGIRREIRLPAGGELRRRAGRPASRSHHQHHAERRAPADDQRAAAAAGKHVFLDKPIANNVTDGRAITEVCRKAGVVLALGYQRRRESHFRWMKQQIEAGVFGKLVNAEANISRDRLGKIDLSSWRYQAAGMPGGVMLQIGIHYTDVLELPDGAGQGGARTVCAARAARRQSRRREPDPRARERRAVDA